MTKKSESETSALFSARAVLQACRDIEEEIHWERVEIARFNQRFVPWLVWVFTGREYKKDADAHRRDDLNRALRLAKFAESAMDVIADATMTLSLSDFNFIAEKMK